MTTEATPGNVPLSDQLGHADEVQTLVERLRTDVLWHQRRGNETIARDCQEAADEIERLLAGLMSASRQLGEWAVAMGKTVDERDRLRAAALEVIEFNRQHANDKYGDANKCETWACVRTLRAALRPNVGAKAPT